MSDLERIIRLKTVLARTGLSRSTMYRKIAEGTFPCQLKISVHGAGWRESAVNRWIANPIAYREEAQKQSCPEPQLVAGPNRRSTIAPIRCAHGNCDTYSVSAASPVQ